MRQLHSHQPPRLVVFFDGGCPLCRREIAHYRRLDRRRRIHWVDITGPAPELAAAGIGAAAAMAQLHAFDPSDGSTRIGVWAFIALWQRLPGYRRLAWMVERLHLAPFLQRVYLRFAAWRKQRRCEGATCRTGP